jgi:aminoglycoside 3-N-acetyltransferase
MALVVEEFKTWCQIGAKRLLSPATVDKLRNRRRAAKRRAVRSSQAESAAPLSQVQLEEHLLALGAQPGRDLFVHSSLSKIGPVNGGAETIIRALLAVIGPKATLLMPAYPMPATVYEWMLDPQPFCLKSSPSKMGALTEAFRTMPGTLRSAHPSHSVSAHGPDADLYTRTHHIGLTPCAGGSPFRIHADRDGDILCIGSGLGKITSYHVVEDLMEDYPVPVYLDQRMAKEVILSDGERCRVEIIAGNPKLSPWRVDNFKPKEVEFHRHLRTYDAVKEGKFGAATSHLICGARFNRMMIELAQKGVTIYHRPALGWV